MEARQPPAKNAQEVINLSVVVSTVSFPRQINNQPEIQN